MQKLDLRGSHGNPEAAQVVSQAESADYGKAVPEARELRILRRGSPAQLRSASTDDLL